MRKWIFIRVTYDDGSTEEWTPESIEKIKGVASELVQLIMNSAVKGKRIVSLEEPRNE